MANKMTKRGAEKLRKEWRSNAWDSTATVFLGFSTSDPEGEGDGFLVNIPAESILELLVSKHYECSKPRRGFVLAYPYADADDKETY